MKFTKIPSTTFETIQMNAGILLSSFDPSSASVDDANILGATSGGIQFSAVPAFVDLGADVDNCPKNTMELKLLDDVEVKCSGSFVTINGQLAKRLVPDGLLNAGHVTTRGFLRTADFLDIWIVGDYSDKNDSTNAGFVAIHLMNTLSTGGFQIQTTDKEKGKFAFEFTAHYSMSTPDQAPYEIYIHPGSNAPGITLDRQNATIAVGETVKLNASTYPTNASVTWASNDTDKATVSNGTVTGVAAGYAVITASITPSSTTYTDACTIKVIPAST